MNKSKSCNSDEDAFQARNWKQYSEKQIQRLHPVQRGRYLAYEPSGDKNGISRTKSRVFEEQKRKRSLERDHVFYTNQIMERKKEDHVMGQIKACEASQRVKSLKNVYQSIRTSEINHLIYTQPTAIKAVRLQSLLPPIPTRIKFKDNLYKEQRTKVSSSYFSKKSDDNADSFELIVYDGSFSDIMDFMQRMRVEVLMEDELGLQTDRILS